MIDKRVEAAAKALCDLQWGEGMFDSALDATKREWREKATTSLAAADAVDRERLVIEACCHEQDFAVEDGRGRQYLRLQPGEELVVRKMRGG